MRLLPLASAFLFAAAVSAQDAQLDALRATLTAVRSHPPEANYETRGATPELTVVKHQLRDWIESRLGSLKDFEHLEAASIRINEDLKTVRLAGSEDDQNLLGSIGDVQLTNEDGLLVITTAVGILCGYDESVYAYRRVNDRWQRIWESEQADYTSDKYAPQHIVAVHVGQSWDGGHEVGPTFFMTLGNEPWCSSNWHTVYYRVWRVDPSGSKLLLDGSDFAFLRTFTYIVGSIAVKDAAFNRNAPVDVMIEFTEQSIDGGVHSREAIRHFLIDGDRVRRADPAALGPRDFVDEWLTQSWDESARWSAAPGLQRWHRKLHSDFVAGEFSYPTMRCRTPDLWQVTVTPSNAKKDFQPEPDVYFLVRWTPPYHFTMMDVSNKGWPRCDQKDPEADVWRTLFNTQEWR